MRNKGEKYENLCFRNSSGNSKEKEKSFLWYFLCLEIQIRTSEIKLKKKKKPNGKCESKITKSPKINKIFHHKIIFIFIFNKWEENKKKTKTEVIGQAPTLTMMRTLPLMLNLYKKLA